MTTTPRIQSCRTMPCDGHRVNMLVLDKLWVITWVEKRLLMWRTQPHRDSG
jgi:hypothetical protein